MILIQNFNIVNDKTNTDLTNNQGGFDIESYTDGQYCYWSSANQLTCCRFCIKTVIDLFSRRFVFHSFIRGEKSRDWSFFDLQNICTADGRKIFWCSWDNGLNKIGSVSLQDAWSYNITTRAHMMLGSLVPLIKLIGLFPASTSVAPGLGCSVRILTEEAIFQSIFLGCVDIKQDGAHACFPSFF